MTAAPGRRITIVLCTPQGDLLGVLPPFDVSLPWWRDATEPVHTVRTLYGLEVTILRLLQVDEDGHQPGSRVTVLAQLDVPADLDSIIEPADASAGLASMLAEDPLRQAYARPGGPAVDLAWADAALEARGTPRTDRPEQQRTWNLSSIWRLPTREGPVWLKVVPPFFAHEVAMISVVSGVLSEVPTVLASHDHRALLADIPGADQYAAPVPTLVRMVRTLVAAQSALGTNVDAMLATGCFDWRPTSYEPRAHDVVERHSDGLDAATRASLSELLRGLPARFDDLESCGIPDSLVHGDFHPGNVRGDPSHLVILDWGDSGVGHPLLDQAAFLHMLAADDRPTLADAWASAWRSAIPGCDPVRAAALSRPLAALRLAILYQLFLDQIETSEHVYHQHDPATWLAKTAHALRMAED